MRTHPTITPLTADERRCLMQLYSSDTSPGHLRDATILAVLLETGLRATELCALTLDSLRGSDDECAKLLIRGKKFGERRALLSRETTALVRAYLGQERNGQASAGQTLFLDGSCPLTSASLSALVRVAGQRAGLVEPVTIHRLRQTAIADAWATWQMARQIEEGM